MCVHLCTPSESKRSQGKAFVRRIKRDDLRAVAARLRKTMILNLSVQARPLCARGQVSSVCVRVRANERSYNMFGTRLALRTNDLGEQPWLLLSAHRCARYLS